MRLEQCSKLNLSALIASLCDVLAVVIVCRNLAVGQIDQLRQRPNPPLPLLVLLTLLQDLPRVPEMREDNVAICSVWGELAKPRLQIHTI